MARQKGIFRLQGKLDNKIFYVDKYGNDLVKTAAGSTKQSEGTKKSQTDFGTAHTARKLIKKGFQPMIDAYGDNRLDDRLKSIMIKLVNTGPKPLQGKRKVTDGDVALLKGFEFNQHTSVNTLAGFSPSITTDPAGKVIVALPKMSIKGNFHLPSKATKAVLQFCSCVFYFDLVNGRVSMPEDLVISLHKASFPGGQFSLPLQDTSDCVLVTAWGIYFTYGDDNMPSHDRRYYAANILDAVNIVDGKIVHFQYPEKVPAAPAVVRQRVQWDLNEED